MSFTSCCTLLPWQVHDNAPAIQLYRSPALGFEVESEESEAFARGLQRPRRLLLTKSLA